MHSYLPYHDIDATNEKKKIGGEIPLSRNEKNTRSAFYKTTH